MFTILTISDDESSIYNLGKKMAKSEYLLSKVKQEILGLYKNKMAISAKQENLHHWTIDNKTQFQF